MDSSRHAQDSQVQSDISSVAAQAFRGENPTQYAQQPQYRYSGPSHAPPTFSIDTEMGNMDSFTASVHDATNSANPLRSSVTGSNIPAHATTSSPARDGNLPAGLGMPTPDTSGISPPESSHAQRNSIGQLSGPQTPYFSTGQRPSIDDSVDPSLSGGDPKRKRSKVSRACDECRRKKVRCDAAGDDGSIKTCTNCAKAGVLCGYNRIPMKRGPSKGYIKELSERVQQVESQMALSGSSGTFRHSMDGSTVYTDQPLRSPDDNMSFKRNYSLSDQQVQRSPFPTSEYSRDRMPSIGWNTISPHTSGFRGSFSAADRHRGSVAIAPDQQAPFPSVASLNQPFWMNHDMDSPRPAKRQKLTSNNDDDIEAPGISQEILAKYYTEFHSNFPILPDGDISIEIVKHASAKIQHAFLAAIKALPDANQNAKKDQPNGQTDTSTSKPAIFDGRESLEEFMWTVAREDPSQRTREDNLLLLWTYLLMAVEAESDLTRLRDGTLSKALIIKQAVDLGWNCIMSDSKTRRLSSGSKPSNDKYQSHWARAWYCAGMLARLHALAVGSSNPIPLQQETPLPNPPSIFPPEQSFLVVSSVVLGSVINLIQSQPLPSQYGRQIESTMRQHVISQLDIVFAGTQIDTDDDVHAQHIRSFYDLLLSRFSFLGAPYEVLQPAVDLAESLKQHTAASQEKYVYDPFNMHLFALTTITLLEFTQDGIEGEMGKVARQALGTIKTTLEQMSEKDHIEDQEQPSEPSGARPFHWTDALLQLIDQRSKAIETSKQNGSHATDSRNEFSVAVDFSKLLKYGYLNVLVESVGL